MFWVISTISCSGPGPALAPALVAAVTAAGPARDGAAASPSPAREAGTRAGAGPGAAAGPGPGHRVITDERRPREEADNTHSNHNHKTSLNTYLLQASFGIIRHQFINYRCIIQLFSKLTINLVQIRHVKH